MTDAKMISVMKPLLERLESLRLAPNSPDTDRFADIVCEELPFEVRQYASGMECNGWVVPQSWWVERAEIRRDGELVYDGAAHPLGVIGYSQSFSGEVSLEELLPHIFTHSSRPEDLVYHCDLFYKLGEKDWGFSMPQNLKDSLVEGAYEIFLETNFQSNTMKVLTCELSGSGPETIVINAHNCHAAQANDDLSGVVVGIEIMKRLAELPERRYTYKLVIAPEHFGTVFYLDGLTDDEAKSLKYGVFLETVGNENRLALQASFDGTSPLDVAADLYLRRTEADYERFEMRGLIGNDETVWEAPGYEIPTISLARFPFPEYHSSSDTAAIISESMLTATVEAVLAILDSVDRNVVMKQEFKGLVALSNPKYDLYISGGGDPSDPHSTKNYDPEWNRLMDRLPRYFDGTQSVLDVADSHDLPFADVREYVGRFADKGLVKLFAADVQS